MPLPPAWLESLGTIGYNRSDPVAQALRLLEVNFPHEAMLETLAVHEIRKVHSDLMEANWGEKLQLLKLLILTPTFDTDMNHEQNSLIH